MALLAVLMVVCVYLSASPYSVGVGAQQCPGACPFNWAPVCGLSAKQGERTFSNICLMTDWNRCFKADYQVKAFTTCS